jgi:malic enzyme
MDTYLELERQYAENPSAYFDRLKANPKKYLPIVYTPTIGKVCLNFSSIDYKFKDLVVLDDLNKDTVGSLLEERDPEVIVLTDGSRILGLGDLGYNGSPIALGKCRVYQALAGIKRVLPLMVDLGTDNQTLLDDPNYKGKKVNRHSPENILDELVKTIFEKCPNVVLQFEDISIPRCQHWLQRYRYDFRVFNDDIQGTASVVLAGLINIARYIGKSPKILMIGAGSAAQGVGAMWADSLYGCWDKLWLKDSRGLLTTSRELGAAKQKFARQHADTNDIGEMIESIQPDVIIGLCAQKGVLTKEILSKSTVDSLAVMSLSNPDTCTEIVPSEFFAVKPNGLYASGTLFTDYPHNQANNMFVFPVIGKIAANCGYTIKEGIFVKAAETLANCVNEDQLRGEHRLLYPDNSKIVEIVQHMVAALSPTSKM